LFFTYLPGFIVEQAIIRFENVLSAPKHPPFVVQLWKHVGQFNPDHTVVYWTASGKDWTRGKDCLSISGMNDRFSFRVLAQNLDLRIFFCLFQMQSISTRNPAWNVLSGSGVNRVYHPIHLPTAKTNASADSDKDVIDLYRKHCTRDEMIQTKGSQELFISDI
jgi:hypothetical protein